MISNIIFVLVLFFLGAVGFLGYTNGKRSAFFSKGLKGLTLIQIFLILLMALDFFFKPTHKEYTDIVDQMYYIVLLLCSLVLWTFPALGYLLAKVTNKVRAALNED